MAGRVPEFVRNILDLGSGSASLRCTVLFFDISGFTSLAEKLSCSGYEGAEILSGILQGLYTRDIYRVIEDAGAFISCFSGDSFTVVAPECHTGRARKLASVVLAGLERNACSEAVAKHGSVSFRVGMSLGEATVVRSGKAFFLHGEPLAAASSMGITDLHAADPPPLGECGSSGLSGEFRRVFTVFTSAPGESAYALQEFTSFVQKAAGHTGGYFGGVHYDGSGPYVMTLFGAPWSRGDNGARALQFIGALESLAGCSLSAGVTAGTVFAGNIGFPERFDYTVIGTTVNTAARIMRQAPENCAWIQAEALAGIPGISVGGEPLLLALRGRLETARLYRFSDFTLREPGSYRGNIQGRSREMASFINAVQQAGPCVLVHGRAGIGKSRFAWEAAASLEGSGWEMVALFCSDMGELVFEPFRPMLRKLFTHEDRWLISAVNSLAELLPLNSPERADLLSKSCCIAALLGFSVNAPEDPKSRYECTLLALRATLVAMAARGPLVLLVEDIQWADSGTAELLELVSRAHVPGLLLLLTARTGDDGSVPSMGIAQAARIDIPLGPLESPAVAGMFSLIAGRAPNSDLLSFLESRSGGNPLFIEQFTRYLLETGGVLEHEGVYSLGITSGDIPHGIADVLQARLDSAPVCVRTAVLTSSVLGQEFSDQVLEEMLGDNPEDTLARGTELDIWRASGPGTHAFSHGLLREAAYSFLLQRNRREIHRRAALAYEKLHPGNHPELARHWEHSDEPASAIGYLDLSAEKAAAAYSLQESVDFRRRLLRLLEMPEYANPPLELRSRKEEMMMLGKLNSWDEALQAAGLSRKLAVESGDSATLAEVLSFTGWLMLRKGQGGRGERFVREGLALARECGSLLNTARSLGHLGAIRFYAGDFGEAERLFLEEMNVLDGLSSPRDQFVCMSNLGCVYKDTGRNSEALDLLNASLSLAEEIGDPDYLTTALGNRAVLYRNLGRFEEALGDHDRALEISSRTGDARSLSVHLGGTALVNYDLGRLDRALELYRRQLALAGDLNWKFGVAEASGYMATCLEAMGMHSEALEKYHSCLAISDEIGVTYYKGIFSVLLAGLLFKEGRFAEAEGHNDEGLSLCSSAGIVETTLMARLLRCRLKIRDGIPGPWIDEMRELTETETDPSLKAFAAHSLWKTLQDIPGADASCARLRALDLARNACEQLPIYDSKKLLSELESAV